MLVSRIVCVFALYNNIHKGTWGLGLPLLQASVDGAGVGGGRGTECCSIQVRLEACYLAIGELYPDSAVFPCSFH